MKVKGILVNTAKWKWKLTKLSWPWLRAVSVFALWSVANLVALWLYCSIKGPFGVWIVLKSNINSGPILRVNTSFLPRLETGIMSGRGLIQVKIQEKVDAIPGECVRAVGMCFYKPVKEFNPGSNYRLCRNAQNLRDSSCIEVKDGTCVRATLNKDFVHLLASFLDTNTVEEPTWCVSFLFSLFWTFQHCDTTSHLTSGLKFLYFLFLSLVLEDARWSRGDSGGPARSHKVTISICVIPTKLLVIEDAFQVYDLTVVRE